MLGECSEVRVWIQEVFFFCVTSAREMMRSAGGRYLRAHALRLAPSLPPLSCTRTHTHYRGALAERPPSVIFEPSSEDGLALNYQRELAWLSQESSGRHGVEEEEEEEESRCDSLLTRHDAPPPAAVEPQHPEVSKTGSEPC